MALSITNISEKVIGIGNVTVLPGETQGVPKDFETNPVLLVYKNLGLVTLSKKTEAAANAEVSSVDEKLAKYYPNMVAKG